MYDIGFILKQVPGSEINVVSATFGPEAGTLTPLRAQARAWTATPSALMPGLVMDQDDPVKCAGAPLSMTCRLA